MRKPIVPLLVKWIDPLVCGQRWKKLDTVLDHLQRADDFFFIQIGANDGIVHDPLYRYVLENRWNGVLVEPVQYYFDLLKQNYAGASQLQFENVAISDVDGYREFFRIREDLDFLPQWTKGLGSFDRAVLMKHRWVIPNIQRYIVQERVECLSFASLLKRHGVDKIDLLMIDTEGYDFEIIKQIDFDGFRPGVIIYEHKHFARSDRLNCEKLLIGRNYVLHRHFGNTLACQA
jgi:FkbM family methyltransferase